MTDHPYRAPIEAEGAATSAGYPMTAVSLFSGVGGMDLACERAGIPVVATAEIDKHARAVLARHFPDAHHYDDVKKVSRDGLLRDTGVVPRLVIGGFPCQDLSVAGLGAGLAGARSGLYFEALRVAQECRAEWVVIENVPGLLSSNRGRDMGTVLGTLADSGYGVAYRVLDAQYFGVAQRRRRVFIVGCLGDDGSASAEVLALAEGSLGHPAPSRPTRQEAAGAAGPGADDAGLPDVVSTLMGGGSRGYRVGAEEAAGGQIIVQGVPSTCGDQSIAGTLITRRDGGDTTGLAAAFVVTGVLGDIAHTLTSEGADASEDGTVRGTPVVTYRKSRRAQTNQDDETWVEDDKTNTINLFDVGDTRATSLIVEPLAFHLTQDPISGAVVPCLSKGSTGNGVMADATVRRLTPTECERLQGFPDGWTECCLKGGQATILVSWDVASVLWPAAVESLLTDPLGSVSCTTSGSGNTELSIYRSGTLPPLTDAASVTGWLETPVPEAGVVATTSHGSGTATPSGLTSTLLTEQPHRPVGGVTTGRRPRLHLVGPCDAARLSTISTWMLETTRLAISTSAPTTLSTDGFTLRWNAPEQSYSGADYFALRVANTALVSDSHRYRQMGNAVAVPCVEWITKRVVAVSGLAQVPRDGLVLDEHREGVQQVRAEAAVAEFARDLPSVRPERIGDADVA